GERQAEEARRRPVAGQGDVAGRSAKKALRPARRRQLVDQVREVWKASVRRACAVLRVDRSLYTYKPRRGDQAVLKQRIKEICQTRVRYGYRRVHVLLVREGWSINIKRTYKLYNESGRRLRHKPQKRRREGSWPESKSRGE